MNIDNTKVEDTTSAPLAANVCYPQFILDACCGGRMFWYEKENPNVLFMDEREVEKGAFPNNWNPNWCVKPDVIADFREMPFKDKHFKLIIFDPPHLTSGSMKSVINKKYGLLNKDTYVFHPNCNEGLVILQILFLFLTTLFSLNILHHSWGKNILLLIQ